MPTDAADSVTLPVRASAARKPIWRSIVHPSRRERTAGVDGSLARIASVEQSKSYIARCVDRCGHESRGLHYTLDYPELADEAVDTVLVP